MVARGEGLCTSPPFSVHNEAFGVAGNNNVGVGPSDSGSSGNAVVGGAGGDGGDNNGNSANGGSFNSGDFSGNGGVAAGNNGNGGNGGTAVGGKWDIWAHCRLWVPFSVYYTTASWRSKLS